MERLLKRGQHSNAEMLAGKQLKDTWLENADLLKEKEAKSQVADTCPSLAEETFRTRVCLSWDEDTMILKK